MSETVAAAAAEAAPAFSRVTLLGRGQRADLVLPSTEPSGALLPDILTLLGGSPTDRGPSRLSLVTSTGIPIPPDMSLAGVGVLDGAVLRLVDDDALPPPPVVHDVTEETAADLERHRGRFSPVSRAVVIVSLTATGAAMASIEVLIGLSATRAFTVLAAAAGACWLAGAAFGALRRAWPATALATAGASCAVLAAYGAGAAHDWTPVDRIGAGLAGGWVTLIVAGALARRRRGPLLGATAGLVLSLGWVALRRSALEPAEADGIVAAVAVVGLGLLPRWALSLSGLASLDDRRAGGETVSRRSLQTALLAAHSTLLWATLAAAGTAGLAGVFLALTDDTWPVWLAGAVATVVLLRARTFPLVAEVVASLSAVVAIAGALALDWLDGGRRLALPLAVTVGVTVLVVIALMVEPPAHIRAQIRSALDRLEALAVIAVIPLLIGVFGVYGRLLHSF